MSTGDGDMIIELQQGNIGWILALMASLVGGGVAAAVLAAAVAGGNQLMNNPRTSIDEIVP